MYDILVLLTRLDDWSFFVRISYLFSEQFGCSRDFGRIM
jgi:hypothetical protein